MDTKTNQEIFVSTKTLSQITIGIFGLLILINAFFLLMSVVDLSIQGWQTMIAESVGTDLFDAFMGVVGIAETICSLSGIVLFLIWLNRSFKNLEALFARDLEFSSGWAVGWWFIPFANLIKPYQVVTEAWRESDPDYDAELGFLSTSVSNPSFFPFWWGFWILSNIFTNAATRIASSSDPAILAYWSIALGVSSFFTIVAAVLLVYIIHDITKRQEMRNTRIWSSIGQAPPKPPTFD